MNINTMRERYWEKNGRERANECTLTTQDIFSLAENVFNLIIIYEFINASDRRRRRQVWADQCVVALHRIYIVMRSVHALGRLYYSYIIWIALKETLFIGLRRRPFYIADYAHGRSWIYGPVITIVMSISWDQAVTILTTTDIINTGIYNI